MGVIGKVWRVALVGAALAWGVPVQAAGEKAQEPVVYHKQKVVYHLNDAELADVALRNIQNHINAVGADKAEIAVVTHGKGIDFLIDEWRDRNGKSFDAPVQNLASQGVRFMVCNNTLTGRRIDKRKLNLNATIVPSGVATVAELQMQGYVYIKP